MNVQDRFAYVGFAVARGMNVTYSNIKFERVSLMQMIGDLKKADI